MRTLLMQDRTHLADIDLARLHAPVGCHSRADACRMAGQPALRDFTHKAVAVGVTADVPAGREQTVERAWDEAAIGHGDHRKFRTNRRADADLICERGAAAPVLALNPRDSREPPRVAHAELRRALQAECPLEPGRVLAEELRMPLHKSMAAYLDFRHVVDVKCGEAGLARSEPHRHVGSPGDVRRLEKAKLLPPPFHQLA